MTFFENDHLDKSVGLRDLMALSRQGPISNLNDTYPLISHLIEYLGHPKSLSPPNDDDCYQQQKTRKSKVSVPVLLTWVNFIIGGARFNGIRSAMAVHNDEEKIFLKSHFDFHSPRDHPFKKSACLWGGGVSPCANGQKVTVHKDQKSPS